MKHPLVAGLLGSIVFVAMAVVGVIWYQLSTLKSQLAQNLGHALGARVEVSSLSLDWWKGELNAAGIVLTNERPEAPWDRGEISQATVRFHWPDLLSPHVPLSLEVASWNVVLHSPSHAASTSAASSSSSSSGNGGKHRIAVTQLSAREGEVEIDLAGGHQILLHGVAFNSADNGAGVWTTQLEASSIAAGSLMLGSSAVQIRGDAEKLTFSDLRMQCADGGITGEGEMKLDDGHDFRAGLKAVDVPVVMLVAAKWQMKLSGLATGNVTYEGNDQGAQAQGQLSLGSAKFNVVPFLSQMVVLVGLPDITNMTVDKATTDFTWKDHVLHLTNIDIRNNGVIRLAGATDIDANEQVDGRLKIGLPKLILSRWPQLQSDVFSVASEDYGWADMHLTGTPDHLKEDLSSRVIATGIQSGSSLINQGAQKAVETLKSFLGQ